MDEAANPHDAWASNPAPASLADKRPIISVAGHIGSGKTEVCRLLSTMTGWDVVSAGAILRQMAVRREITILQMNEYAQSHSEVDVEVDGYIKSLAQSSVPVIVDSRLAWHFLPSSTKVYLIVEPEVAAARVFQATRPDEKYKTMCAARIDNEERQRIERQRYLTLYSVDCELWRNYDIVVDTSYATPEEVSRLVLAHLAANRSGSPNGPECWISPRRLLPTQPIADVTGPRFQSFKEGSSVAVGVYEGSCLILDGHSRVSDALRNGESLIRCRLIAFESEEVSPGLNLQEFARTATTLSCIHEWETAHSIKFAGHPRWIVPKNAELSCEKHNG